MRISPPSTAEPNRRSGTALSRLATLAALTATLTAAGSLVPAAAQAAGPYGAAYVWMDAPDAGMCIVPADHQWNSTDEWNPVNEICSEDVGLYSVDLPNLGVKAGTVQVTAYGSDAAYCKVQSWAPSGTAQRVMVRCLDAGSAPVDSQFTLSYANLSGTRTAALGYAFANQPTATAPYNSPANYQYNSSGATNTITKVSGSTGVYTVNLPGLAGTGGNPVVTAYGTGSEWCTAWNWAPAGADLHIQVRCFSTTGAPANSRFTLSYAKNGNILGTSLCCGPDGHPTNYLFANDPTASSYVPAAAYRFASGGGTYTGKITRISTGRYDVNYGWAAAQGVVHVTPVGGGTARCKLESWTTDERVTVACTGPSGSPVDATFLLHHVGPFVIG